MRKSKDETNLRDKDIQTLLTFAKNNMRYKPSAAELGCHFETVSRRLDSIYRRTLLNPKEFYDLIKLVQRIQDEDSEVSDE